MVNSLRVTLALLLVTLAFLARPTIASAATGPVTVNITAPSSVQAGAPFAVNVSATNDGSALSTWSLSVALPDGGKAALVSPAPFSTAESYARVFLPGDSLYNFVLKRSISASYPLAEEYQKQTWPTGAQRTLSVDVTPPSGATTMRLFIRVAAVEPSGAVVSFAQAGSTTDQQGLSVIVRSVTITAVPPLAVPTTSSTATTAARPTAAPTPSPMATPASTPTTLPIVGPVGTAVPTATLPIPTPTPSGVGGQNPVLNLLLTLAGLLAVAGLVTLFTAWRSGRSPTPVARGIERAATSGGAKPAAARPPAPSAQRHDLAETASFRLPAAGSASAQTLALPPFPAGLTPVGEVKRGGMADVYRAYQPALDRYVAVKMPKPAFAADAGFAARFREEARRTARLNHPNIVTVYDVGEVEGTPYISMRYVDGPSLADLIASAGQMPPRRALDILEQIAAALDYAHSQEVVHGDVKPSNVLVDHADQVTLTDFGIARAVGSESATQAMAFGTPDYISPELARGEAVGPASDVYSLGVVAYELLVGRKPFNADNPLALVYAHAYSPPPPPDQLNPRLSTETAQVLLRALAKDPSRRYSTAAQFVAALRREARA